MTFEALAHAPFGETPRGERIDLYTLRNPLGMEVRVATYGGVVTRLTAPDRRGECADVVLGFESIDGYLEDDSYLGALIGRFANRIANARFELDGRVHELSRNDGANCLHGGAAGFNAMLWQVVGAEADADRATLALRHVSADGDQGFPGTLIATAVYTLDARGELRVDLAATTDRTTVVSLTQHSYFNLAGRGDVLGHRLQVDARRFTPVRADLIPTGEIRSVEGTPFDFREPHALGARLGAADEQLELAGGYDHNFAVADGGGTLRRHATLHDPGSGRLLEVYSTEPGLQVYSGNQLDGSRVGSGGRRLERHAGVCLEPQRFPDSPNRPNFPSAVLPAGARYAHSIAYRFAAE
jgi:aldose 1-epimerase